MRSLKKKSVRSGTSFRGALQIGPSLAIPCWSWRKVVTAGAPTMKTVSKAALETAQDDDFDPQKTIFREARHYVASAPDADVPPHMSVSGYRYGKDVVPIAGAVCPMPRPLPCAHAVCRPSPSPHPHARTATTPLYPRLPSHHPSLPAPPFLTHQGTCARQDAERIKYGVDQKCLQLIGCLPTASLPRHLITSKVECVVADPESLGPNAHKALQAFLLALEEDDLLAIARYAPRKNAAPTLVALWPAVRSFWMGSLPFADELKAFDWGPPPTAPPPSAPALEAAGALIDAMELCPEGDDDDDDDDAPEALHPKHVFSPKLQRLYQCIASRALSSIGADAGGSGSGQGGLPPVDWRVTRPFMPDDAITANAAGALAAFVAACPLTEAAAAGSKRRGTARSSASDADDAGKRLRTGGGIGASPSKSHSSNAPLQLTHVAPDKVDSAQPVITFLQMIEDKKGDRVEAAVNGMCAIIRDLLRTADGTDDAIAQKGFTCLRELRKGAVMCAAHLSLSHATPLPARPLTHLLPR